MHLEPRCGDRVVAALAPSDGGSAREALAVVVASEPDCVIARREFAAQLLVDPTDASAALGHLEVVLVLDPENARARELLVVAYLETGGLGAASESAAALAAEHPDRGTTHMLLGLVARARGEIGAARVHFETAVALDPELFDAQIALADIALDVRDPEAAVTAYTAALWLRPDSYEAWLGRGIALRSLGPPFFEVADAAYERALALAPERPEAYFDRALLHHFYSDGTVASLERAITYYSAFVARAGPRPDLATLVDDVVRECEPEPPSGAGVHGAAGASLRRAHRAWARTGCRPGYLQLITLSDRDRGREMARILRAAARSGATGTGAVSPAPSLPAFVPPAAPP